MKWIPVEEALPKSQNEYLATVNFDGDTYVECLHYGKPLMANREVKGECFYDSDDEWGDVVYDIGTEVIAWMPLPQPYTADRKTEPQTDLLVTEYPQDGEVNLIGKDKTEAVVMAYDIYKEMTEPQLTEKCPFDDSLPCEWVCTEFGKCKYKPKTEMEKSGSRAVLTARCLNCHNAKDCKENHWEVCEYEPWKLTAVEDEPQTDCSWK